MSEPVWICNAPSDGTLAEIIEKTDLNVENDERIVEIGRTARTGGIVDPDQFPTEAWGGVGGYRAHHFQGAWPHIFYYAGFWIVSETTAFILRQFDLGAGHVRPLRLFEKDRSTTVPGNWSIWNIGNIKQALLPDRSQGLRPAAGRTFALMDAEDHDVKCSRVATMGPDIWIDPNLRQTLFLSAELGQAVGDAGLATEKAGFGKLIKCEIVEI